MKTERTDVNPNLDEKFKKSLVNRRSAILTVEQVNQDLLSTVKGLLKDATEKYLNDPHEKIKREIDNLLNFVNWEHKQRINMWCQLFSEHYLNENPKVDDVLLLTETVSGQLYCEWMISR